MRKQFHPGIRLFAAIVLPLLAAGANPPSDFQRLLDQGRRCVERGDYKQATDVLEQAVSLDNSNSNAFLWLGRAYGHRAETAFPLNAPRLAMKARDDFEKAVALDPRNWDAVDDLFDYYLEAPGFLGGGVDKASRLIDRSVKLEPSQAARQAAKMVKLGKYLANHGRYPESDEAFRRALAAAPAAPNVVYARASVLIETKRNIPEARELLKRYLALNLSPSDPPREQAEQLLRQTPGS